MAPPRISVIGMPCEIINTGVSSAVRNMEIDLQLLKGLASDNTCKLHIYDWSAASATYGYFANPFQSLDAEKVSQHALQLARRPTGGGVIFHIWDFAFSFLMPSQHPAFSINTLENYATVNRMLAETIRRFSGGTIQPELLQEEPKSFEESCACFCMAKPTQFDVMAEGRKVSGGAQRRTRHGFLHQGTISLVMPDRAYLEEVLIDSPNVLDGMDQNSYALLKGSYTAKQLREAKQELEQCLVTTGLGE